MNNEAEQAWIDIEARLTTKILPQYAAEISTRMNDKNFRDFLLSAAAQNFDEQQLCRMVENILILNGVTPK